MSAAGGAEFLVFVKDATNGHAGQYVLVQFTKAPLYVGHMIEPLFRKFKWDAQREDDILLYFVSSKERGKSKPEVAQETTALSAEPLEATLSVEEAGITTGCFLLAKCTAAAVAGAAGGAATGGAAQPVLLAGGGGIAFEPVLPEQEAMVHAQSALFAILDTRGHPIGCGFFVSASGVALTIHRSFEDWTRADQDAPGRRLVQACKLDGSGKEVALTFSVVSTNEVLDFTVLKLLSVPQAGVLFYPLPPQRLPAARLWGHWARIVHGNLALNSQFDQAPNASVAICNIATVHPQRLLYTAATSAGDSGGALLLQGKDLIGLHVEGVNDVYESPRGSKRFKTPSEASSPSTSACALRLDIDEIREAVAQAELA